jgi:ATP-binding cassette, subfamily B, bacterial HlyB/CyaB
MSDGGAPASCKEAKVGPADATAVIGALCTLHRIPFDAQLLRQRHPPPHPLPALLLALRELGFHARALRCEASTLESKRLPLLARLHDGSVALVLQATDDEVLAWRGEAHPQRMALARFAEAFTGDIVQARPQAKAPADPDGAAGNTSFGFRWFVPELLKHRRVWRSVLLASLFLQLLSLAFPLITQAVVDKVVVHRTLNTLVVLGLAMAIVVVFSASLGWLRQYLVLHTGNRVDAVLGASVFQHLFRLPVSYFERRSTGVIAARLHGVETIREFIASAAVTLVLDLPFLLVAVAVMFFYSVKLTLIVLGVLALVGLLSFALAPVFQQRLNRQFLLGARNQAFVTEHVAGHETVKSLQMEPMLEARWGDHLATYLQSGFATRQIGNTYNTVAQALEQLMTVLVLMVGAWTVMNPVPGAAAFTIGMLVAFQMTR